MLYNIYIYVLQSLGAVVVVGGPVLIVRIVYVIKVVSDLRLVDGFLRLLQFPPPIKLTATI
jgi:hypothetical protein